jgi:hypothetical protein
MSFVILGGEESQEYRQKLAQLLTQRSFDKVPNITLAEDVHLLEKLDRAYAILPIISADHHQTAALMAALLGEIVMQKRNVIPVYVDERSQEKSPTVFRLVQGRVLIEANLNHKSHAFDRLVVDLMMHDRR